MLNPGSVGQPRDGDPRAAYAIVEDGAVTLKRATYDVQRTVDDLKELPLEASIVEQLSAILRNGQG